MLTLGYIHEALTEYRNTCNALYGDFLKELYLAITGKMNTSSLRVIYQT